MLDLRAIRQNTPEIRAALVRKGGDEVSARLDRILAADQQRRDILGEVEVLKKRRNEVSKEIGHLRGRGGDATAMMEDMKNVSASIKQMDDELREIESTMRADLEWLPNPPHPDVPDGATDADNVELRVEGQRPEFGFTPRNHIDLGQELGILDTTVASKLAGTGFSVLRGAGSKLNRALIQWMLDLHTTQHGYNEVWTPAVAREGCLFNTGQLPKLRDDMYHVEEHDLFLIPTAEVTITNILSDETLPEADLPLRLVGYTPCFRREAGAAGRDTRGLLRLHQFDKVELVRITHPERSWTDHQELLADAESVLRNLGLHYRVVELCTGDLSFAAARCYDLEVWAPGEDRWLEVSSCSNFVDFQARRLGTRMQPTGGGKSAFCHTLNASGLALPRLLVALFENYQTEQGTIRIPEVLQPYMHGLEEIAPDTAASPAGR